MTLCPIAIVAGCRKCPAFSVCPLKTVLGDHVADRDAPSARKDSGAAPGKAAKKK